jgi:hypothetical protein
MKDLRNEQDTLKYHLMVYERFLITDALRKAHGNCAQAARILGTTERVINYKVKKYEIDYKQYRRTNANEINRVSGAKRRSDPGLAAIRPKGPDTDNGEIK